MLASYTKKWADVTLRDIGFVEQAEIFDMVARSSWRWPPPVVDADDILADPRARSENSVRACGIPFDDAMLSWPPGPKPFDGVWAPHWYNAVWASTGWPQSANDDARELPDRTAQKSPRQPGPIMRSMRALAPQLISDAWTPSAAMASLGDHGWATAFLFGQHLGPRNSCSCSVKRGLRIGQLVLQFGDRTHQIVAPPARRLGRQRIIEMAGIGDAVAALLELHLGVQIIILPHEILRSCLDVGDLPALFFGAEPVQPE